MVFMQEWQFWKQLQIRKGATKMTVIANGFIINEFNEPTRCNIRLEEEKIVEIGSDVKPLPGEKVIDATDLIVTAGFIDVHVHLREPGFEQKETIASGTLAAAHGGFTTICAMPNTNPVPDSAANMQALNKRIKADAKIRVLPYGAITKQLKADATVEELVDFDEVGANGAFAFSDDGVGVQTAGTMYKAMAEAARLNKAIVAHCEDNSLILGGSMHDGRRSEQLGVKGIPSVCESVQIARDVLLAEATDAHYHVCHVSTVESVRVIRDAKAAGIHVTCEVCPHHLISDENDITGDTGNWKMNPPLRATRDRQALIAGLIDGTIDCISTDHAPHCEHEKCGKMADSAFGIVGSETAFAQLYTHFVKTKIFTLKQLLDWMSSDVARTFNLPYGKLEVGASADIVLIDLDKEKTITTDDFLSQGKNTPYTGQTCSGWPVHTIYAGQTVWMED